MSRQPTRSRLRPWDKVALAFRIWRSFFHVRSELGRTSLPGLVDRLSQQPSAPQRELQPRRLGHIVGRVLRIGPYRPRCLHASLVLFLLLRQQGVRAELVIGLPQSPRDKDAHAWIEVGGVDVGPPPGRGECEELARYG